MIPAAIELATVFLIFGGWFALSFFAAIAIGRLIRGPRQIETHSRPRLGVPSSPVTSLAEEQQRRANRALLDQRKRWGDAA